MPLPPSQPTSTKASKLDSKIIWNPPIPAIDLTEVHQTISLHGLLAVASQLRDGKECAFALETDTKPFSGGQCIIFVVEYSDSIKYAFRLPYHTRKSAIRDSFFAHELEKWKAMISNRIPLIPEIFDFGLSDDNLIGFPFIAYEWVKGKQLVWNDDEPWDPAHREKIIKTLASFTIETACRMQKPGKTSSAEVYVTEAIDRKIKRVLNGTLRTAKLIDCLRQRSLIHRYVIPELNDSPWVMVHGDLSNSNIITDPEHDISGIIDFGFSEYLPLQFAAVFPLILCHETYQDQNDIDVALELPHDSQSSLVWRSKNTETKRRDRQLFLDEIKRLCKTHGEICESFYRILSDKQEIRRYWWFTAISNQKLHQVMVKVNWLLPEEEFVDEGLSNEWKMFRAANPGCW